MTNMMVFTSIYFIILCDYTAAASYLHQIYYVFSYYLILRVLVFYHYYYAARALNHLMLTCIKYTRTLSTFILNPDTPHLSQMGS